MDNKKTQNDCLFDKIGRKLQVGLIALRILILVGFVTGMIYCIWLD